MRPVKNRPAKKKITIARDLKKDILIKLVRRIVPFLVISGVIFSLILGIKIFFLELSYFKVASVTVTDKNAFARKSVLENSEMLKLLKGKSIFLIDIEALAQSIQRDYPELKSVKVCKIMPNSLEVRVDARLPIALIKSFRFYPVDKDGIVLSPEIELNTSLPVIAGLPIWTRPRVGERLDSERLNKAFLLIKNLRNVDIPSEYAVQQIEVSNVRNVLLFLRNGLEIRIGAEAFGRKLEQLEIILKDPEIDKNNLKYIDLRFNEGVLAPR